MAHSLELAMGWPNCDAFERRAGGPAPTSSWPRRPVRARGRVWASGRPSTTRAGELDRPRRRSPRPLPSTSTEPEIRIHAAHLPEREIGVRHLEGDIAAVRPGRPRTRSLARRGRPSRGHRCGELPPSTSSPGGCHRPSGGSTIRPRSDSSARERKRARVEGRGGGVGRSPGARRGATPRSRYVRGQRIVPAELVAAPHRALRPVCVLDGTAQAPLEQRPAPRASISGPIRGRAVGGR